jgi:hypothetical protein
MTVPLPPRAHFSRRLAAIAAVGLLAAVTPVAVAAPAEAAPEHSSPCPAQFGSTAASELLALRLLDLTPLGLPLPPVADLHVSTTRSGMAGGPPHSASEARYVQAALLGKAIPSGVLAADAYQQAPPPHDHPTVVPSVGLNLPVLKVGTGGLTAHATIHDAGRCGPGSGPRSDTGASVGKVRVLPQYGSDRALIGLDALNTNTSAYVSGDRGHPAATATATGDLTKLQLFAGTPQAIGVNIVSQPALQVTASGHKHVDYKAPVLEVKLPGQAPKRLSAPGAHLDVAVPLGAADAAQAAALGRAEGLPVLSGLPLGTLLSGLPSTLGNAGAGAGPDVSAGKQNILGDLPGVPGLNGITDDVAGGLLSGLRNGSAGIPDTTEHGRRSTPGGPGGPGPRGQVLVLRLSLGELTQQITSTGVHAKAASLRVKLLLRTAWAGHPGGAASGSDDGYGGAQGDDHDASFDDNGTAVLDLGLCVLEAAAAAPKADLPPYGGDSGYGNGYGGTDDDHGNGGVSGATPPPAAGGPATLPVTGSKVGLVLGSGVVLLLAGRLLMVLARRRFTA